MAKSPFYIVQIAETGEDITAFVDSFSYEGNIEKDDLLKLSLTFKNVFELDEEWLTVGEKLKFFFGYIGGLQTPIKVAKISDVQASYGDVIKVSIDATDVGMFLKKNSGNTIHNKKTLSGLVKEVADKYSLKFETVETKKVYNHIPQAQKSDFDFLSQMAKRENLVFRVSSETLFLEKRDLLKESIKTYTWGTDIISFVPKVKHSQQDSSSQKIQSNSVNLKDNTVQTSEAKADDKEKEKLGDYVIQVDANGNKKKVFPTKKEETAKNDKTEDVKLVQGKADKTQNDGIVNRQQEDKSLGDVTATLVVEGNPILEENQVLTIAGVAKKHEGNWKIISVKHNPSTSGYTTTLELKKNATNKPVGNTLPDKATSKNQEVNKSTGTTQENESTTKVLKFDQNGNPIK